MRIVDMLMAFPGILLNIAIVATVARPGVGVMIVALCAERLGRLRARRPRPGARAARARLRHRGASRSAPRTARIMLRHLVPNLLAPALVQMTFGVRRRDPRSRRRCRSSASARRSTTPGARCSIRARRSCGRPHSRLRAGARPRDHVGRARREPARRRPARSVRSPRQDEERGAWVPRWRGSGCARLDEVPAGSLRAFPVGAGHPGPGHRGSTAGVRGLAGVCPHEDVGSPAASSAARPGTCPGHGYGFDILTGRCEHDAELRLRRFPVQVVDGEIHIRVDLYGVSG